VVFELLLVLFVEQFVATLDFKICVFVCFRLSFSINVQEVIVNRDDKSKLLQSNFVNGMPFEIPSDLCYIRGSFALRFFVFHTVFVIVINETPDTYFFVKTIFVFVCWKNTDVDSFVMKLV